MANFFTRSMTKEGPGVDKDAPKKKRFFLFFEVAARKFWKIIGVGLLYILCCIPVVTFGPASCGLSLVLRNFAREEHAFVTHDFFRGFKENFKQGLVVGLLNLIAVAMTGYACFYYFQEMQTNTVIMAVFVICLLCLIFEIFMSFYAYTMIVTFSLKTNKLIKNAFLFSLLGIRTNIITLFWLLLMAFLTVFLFTVFPALLFLLPLVMIPFAAFIVAFNAYGPLKKFLIDPQLEKEAKEAEGKNENGEDSEDEDTIFSDKLLND